jgi:small subunit ribosomal protein S9
MADEEQQDEDAQPEETPAGASDEVADQADQGVPDSGATPADTGSEAEDVGVVQDADSEGPADEPAAGTSDEVADQADQGVPDGGATPADTGSEAEDVGGDTQAADAEEPLAGDAEKPKPKDAAPGADLEPIALEPERELSAEERARAEAEAEERAAAEADEDVVADEPLARKAIKLDSTARIQATGKRKSAIARVVVRQGSGTFEINSRQLEEYFPRHQHQSMARQPLVTAGYEGTVDVRVRVHGGGVGGQAGAVRHGIARALTAIDPELRGELKRRGFLTRDAREKERRKAGLKKARKRPQFSKR